MGFAASPYPSFLAGYLGWSALPTVSASSLYPAEITVNLYIVNKMTQSKNFIKTLRNLYQKFISFCYCYFMEETIDKNYDLWNETKKILRQKTQDEIFYKRDVWWCALGLNIGSEQDGKNEMFERPVLIIKKYNKDMLLVAPFTSKQKDNQYYLSLDSGINSQLIISQLRTVSSKRLLRKIETISTKDYITVILQIIKGLVLN